MTDESLMDAALKFPGLIMPPYGEIIGKLGFTPVFEFAEHFGGCQVYVPRKRHIFKDCLENAVLQEFDGANYVYLAVKYGFCEKTVRKIVKKSRDRRGIKKLKTG